MSSDQCRTPEGTPGDQRLGWEQFFLISETDAGPQTAVNSLKTSVTCLWQNAQSAPHHRYLAESSLPQGDFPKVLRTVLWKVPRSPNAKG